MTEGRRMPLNSYELMLIVNPALEDERLNAILDRVKNLVDGDSGVNESVDDWGVRRLAYPINKLEDGRYLLINFQAKPSLIETISQQLRLVVDVERFVVVRKGD